VACSKIFDKSSQAIYNAKNSENNSFEILKVPLISRDKVSHKTPYAIKFFSTLPTKSGMLNRNNTICFILMFRKT
jgi:hypothetical protein